MKNHTANLADQLIGLRLTEHDGLMAGGVLPVGIAVPRTVSVAASSKREGSEDMTPVNSTGSNSASPMTGQMGTYHPDGENIVAASPDAEQNADEAAEYWARL